MNDMQTYLNILIQSLQQKQMILDILIELTKRQELIIVTAPFDENAFNETIDRKAECLKKLENLDQGFQLIYDKVATLLQDEKSKNVQQIQLLQTIITSIMEKSAVLQALELKNKDKLENYTKQEREKIRNYKVSSRTAANYYKMMSGHKEGDTYFLDTKS